MEKLSSHLKRLLEVKGIRQTELAKRASISQGAVSRYVNGLQEPKSRELHAISKALGVSMESWFTGLGAANLDGEREREYGKLKSRADNAEQKLKKMRASLLKFSREMKKMAVEKDLN